MGVLDRVRDHGRGARQHARVLPPQALALNRGTLAPLAAYTAISFLYFGVPVASHFGRNWIGSGADPQIFVWSLAWWPHAITHGQNPIVTHAVWPPVGLDLTWVSSVPALAAAFAPVTFSAGAVAAYNAASILMPALAAWTAYLLCRHLTRSLWPSLAGGYLFGFSSYELGQLQGHLHMSSVFLVPLAALVLVRYVEGTLSETGVIVRLGPLLALQFLLSTELLFTVTLAIVVAAAAAWLLLRDRRRRVARLWRPLAGAYAAAAVLTSPLLVYALLHFQHSSLNDPRIYSADLLNLVVPTRLTALSIGWTRRTAGAFLGHEAENGAYLGLPLLAIVCWYAWQRRHSSGARLLITLFVVAIVTELGPALRVREATYAPLPWKALVDLPLLNNVLPVRFAMYAALAAAVAAATWAAGCAPRPARLALTALAVAATAPALAHGYWRGMPDRPAFFAAHLYRTCLPRDATVLALPYPSLTNAMLWQAEAGFRFRLADAWLSPVVPDGVPHRNVVEALYNDAPPPGGGAAIVKLARAQGAGAIVVDAKDRRQWSPLLAATGLRAQTVGGIDLYDLGGTLAGCRSRSGHRGASSTSSR